MKTEPKELTQWIKCVDRLPKESVEVNTKIDDINGVRNETTLTLYRGLWFFPDMSMYVYYKPTHWSPL